MNDTILKPTIIKYTLLLLVGQLIAWWTFFISPFDIPEKIPFTTIRINGLTLIVLLLVIIISALKKILKLQPETTIIKLTFLGAIICFFSGLVFQTVRQPTLNADTFNERIFYFLLGTLGTTIFGTAVSFLTAFQLKKRKTGQLIILIIGLLLIMNLIKYFTQTLTGK
jgi:hypothetical protein